LNFYPGGGYPGSYWLKQTGPVFVTGFVFFYLGAGYPGSYLIFSQVTGFGPPDLLEMVASFERSIDGATSQEDALQFSGGIDAEIVGNLER